MRRSIFALSALLLAAGAAFASPRDRMVAELLRQAPAAVAHAAGAPTRVSVAAIDCAAKDFDVAAFQDQLTAAIMDSGAFQVIDRKSLDVLLKEQELSLSGLVDTGAMVQAGKLVGVQGFFFGSLDLGKDRAILTLKLVDTGTGAVVLSKKISASDPAFLQLGPELGYTFLPLDTTGDGTADVTDHAVGFGLSYRQGFEALGWGFAGADLLFYRAFSPDPALTVSCATIKPKLYLYLGGPGSFFLTPYAGASLEMLLLGEDASVPTALDALPLLGLDLNPTRTLTAYCEGGWRFRTLLKQGSGVSACSGPSLTAGVRLHFGL